MVGHNVKDFGFCTEFRLNYTGPDRSDGTGYLRGRVIQVAEDEGAGNARLHAGRSQARVHSGHAEVAFVGGIAKRVDEPCIIGAGCYAHAAAYTLSVVHDHNAVLVAFHGGLDRADLDTGRHVAMIAQPAEKQISDVGKGTFLESFDPRAPVSRRDVVLALTRDGATVAPDATPLIYEHSPAFRPRLLRIGCNAGGLPGSCVCHRDPYRPGAEGGRGAYYRSLLKGGCQRENFFAKKFSLWRNISKKIPLDYFRWWQPRQSSLPNDSFPS